ncbi:Serine/threonine-protein kinase AfsK [Symmachiella macrocystis]|uniref:Serine/threonine-protein kinase AfsK n=2 Tax=Symmachiella macrocystis TaxID=2527985 RepID=A0A5C6BH03_9PLAN|nr:Serine/threonine-protein kinase AfsK [Symmachiella macrocystis]
MNSRMPILANLTLVATLFMAAPTNLTAGDWPMFRYDAGRTASSPHELPTDLQLQWAREYSPRITVWDDPLNQDLMKYDRVFEPIILGDTLYIGFNDSDKVVALDTKTGEEKWRVYVDGPVRFPPAAEDGKVYFVSDDGFLYCVSAETGEEIWKFRGGPSDRRILGNERLISTWPARGAPVLRDGSVYFAASIWPFMGTFIYALDAETGQIQWVNDGTGADYLQQPHNYPAFAGVAPQGCLVATKDKLIIPGGRSIPAVFDRETGRFEYFHLAKYGKSGGSWAFANDDIFFGHERDDEYSRFDIKTGNSLGRSKGKQPVVSDDGYYYCGDSIIKRPLDAPGNAAWELEADANNDMIRAGDRLYAAGKNGITIIQLPQNGEPQKIVGRIPVEGDVKRLIAADDRLFAVTLDGKLMAFGADEVAQPVVITDKPTKNELDEQTEKFVEETLHATDDRNGYAVMYGVQDNDALEALARQTDFNIIGVSPDAEIVEKLRRRLDDAGLYGSRIALHVGEVDSFDLPPYFSSFTFGIHVDDPETLKTVFETLRPYGGRALFVGEFDANKKLIEQAGLEGVLHGRMGDISIVTRKGALPGAGDWTHQYGNIRNTIKSDDKLVKLPLGILWFGGSSNMDVLPRHGHGPPEQIIGGRLYIQGMDSLSARDVYTGRVIWKTLLKNLGTYGTFFDQTYKNTPLSTEYNQVHIPGSNARGTNFIATEDKVYIIEGKFIRVLDARDGSTVTSIPLPKNAEGESPESWGYLGVAGDALIAGAGFADFSKKLNMPHDESDKRRSKWRFTDYDKSASAALVVMDRQTGKIRWRAKAQHGFLHNAITAMDGVLYCLDKLPPNLEEKLRRRGQAKPETYKLTAYDLQTGEPLWQTNENVFGTWLSCSQEHGLMLQSTRPSNDTVRTEDGSRMIAYKAKSGEVVWDKPLKYSTPPILHGDDIIAGGKMYSLLTGDVRYRTDPITGQKAEWTFVSTKGCNYPIASENLITFRSSAAAFFDLTGDGGTGHFGGFKSGCTSNLIAAGGLLNAPDYTRTCRCSFQNQTSLAMVHMPGLEIWTHNDFAYDGNRVKQVGINFGAPGDRRADNGTLWMEFPSVGGPSPNIDVSVNGDIDYFRHHASRIDGEQPWVAASGVTGAQDIVIHLTPKQNDQAGLHVPVKQDSDDAEEASNGDVSLGSSDLELVEDSSSQTVGIRFQDVPIPRGTKIKSAYIQFKVDEPSSAEADMTITAEATANAAEFTKEVDNLSSRKRTKAEVNWKPKPWLKEGDTGLDQRTADLTALLQEIVDGPDWKPGNAVAFLIEGSGSHVAKARDRDKEGAPQLVLDIGDSAPKKAEVAIRPYTVRLFFTEPNSSLQPGQRQFDVTLQDTTVLKDFDITAAAEGPQRAVIREFHGIPIEETLTIGLGTTGPNKAVLSGVEVIAED